MFFPQRLRSVGCCAPLFLKLTAKTNLASQPCARYAVHLEELSLFCMINLIRWSRHVQTCPDPPKLDCHFCIFSHVKFVRRIAAGGHENLGVPNGWRRAIFGRVESEPTLQPGRALGLPLEPLEVMGRYGRITRAKCFGSFWNV